MYHRADVVRFGTTDEQELRSISALQNNGDAALLAGLPKADLVLLST